MKKQELLSQELGQLLETQETADSQVTCQGVQFPCHLAILAARAPGFNLASGRQWQVEGVKTRTTELLVLASLYCLPEMAEATRKRLLEEISDKNMLETLVTLDKYRVGEKDEFREKVVEFVMSRVEKLWDSDDWKVFSMNHGLIVSDIMKALFAEKASGKMLLEVAKANGGSYKVEVLNSDTVQDLKSKIKKKDSDFIDEDKLISSGRLMKETDTLSDHNIISSSKIYISSKMFDCCECSIFDYYDCTCDDEMEPLRKRKRY